MLSVGIKRLLLVAAFLLPSLVFAQGGVSTPIISSAEPLPNCAGPALGQPTYIISDLTAGVLKYCSATNTWTAFGSSGNVSTGQTNVYGAFLQDFSAATMEIPEAAGFTTNVNSTIGLDTTANACHLFVNNADALCAVESAGIIANALLKSTDATHGLITASLLSDNGTTLTYSGTTDFHAAAHTLPAVSAATAGALPGGCTTSELGFVTGATAGQNIYECNGGVWTQQLNSGAAGASTSLGNLAAVAVNTSLICAAVNTCAFGSAAIPWTNFFFGTVANQSISGNTANLTANRVVNWPDATSSPVRDCPAVANNFLTAIAVATGTCTQAQPTLANIAAGAAPAGLFDFTASTVEIPEAAGFTANVNSTIGLDTTANAVHFWINNADSINAAFPSAPAGSKCVQTSGTIGLLSEVAGVCGTTTPSTVDTFTNKTENVESTGNVFSEPVRAYFTAAGCNNSTAGNAIDIGTTNAPTPQCAGSTVRKAVLQFVRGNVAYINWHLPSDWNSSASTDIELGMTTTDITNTDVIAFNVQTGCSKNDGTATDDPSLNAAQTASFTIGPTIANGAFTFKLAGLTMTGCTADYFFEIALTRNNSGVDTATNVASAAALKFAEIIVGVTKNAANR